MFNLRAKKTYKAPLTAVTEVDLEGLVCMSAFKTVQVDELHNINYDSEAAEAEELYFEF